MREGYPGTRVPGMATQSAQFEPVAWWWARNKIGRDLRELYEVPKELPPKLLTLVRKLDVVADNQLSPRSRALLKKIGRIRRQVLVTLCAAY